MSQLGIFELHNELSSLIHMSKEILDSNSTNQVNKDVKEKIQALDEAFYLDSELYADQLVDSEAMNVELNTQEQAFLRKDVEKMELEIEKLEKELTENKENEKTSNNQTKISKENCKNNSTIKPRSTSQKDEKSQETKHNQTEDYSSLFEEDDDIFDVTSLEDDTAKNTQKSSTSNNNDINTNNVHTTTKDLLNTINNKWYLSTSGITDLKALNQINRFKSFVTCPLSSNLNILTTHLIIHKSGYKQSLDVMEAILTNRKVLWFDWLEQCVLQNCIIDYKPYLLQTTNNNGDDDGKGNGDDGKGDSSGGGLSSCLEKYQLCCLVPAEESFTAESIGRLVQMMGGGWVHDPALFDHKSQKHPVILIHKRQYYPSLEHVYSRARKAVTRRGCSVVDVQWILNIIINNIPNAPSTDISNYYVDLPNQKDSFV